MMLLGRRSCLAALHYMFRLPLSILTQPMAACRREEATPYGTMRHCGKGNKTQRQRKKIDVVASSNQNERFCIFVLESIHFCFVIIGCGEKSYTNR
jgi:hypothetical protein